jgi:hypothetical protein
MLLAYLPGFDRPRQRKKLNEDESNDVSTFLEFVWGQWIWYGSIELMESRALTQSRCAR